MSTNTVGQKHNQLTQSVCQFNHENEQRKVDFASFDFKAAFIALLSQQGMAKNEFE